MARKKKRARIVLLKHDAFLPCVLYLHAQYAEKNIREDWLSQCSHGMSRLTDMPKIQIPEKLERILTTPARFIVLIGGRSSAKTETVGRVCMMKMQTEQADILCGREYQNSIDDSVHKLLRGLIAKLDIQGMHATDKKIDCLTGGGARFKGFSRNPDAVKSAQDFKYSWFEEAQTASQSTLDELLPTIRAKGSKLFFTANPQSSADPFSKRFIVPYHEELLRNGFYEDELHLVILCNWRDNPWHGELELQRKWDYDHLPRATYDWIWEGAFNDSVENSLVLAEWFDACVDAHIKLGFEPEGAISTAHDPSDTGPDSKGFGVMHGVVITEMVEKLDGDINEGCDWATGLSIQSGSDSFAWDVIGVGTGLKRQVANAFKGKKTTISMFNSSEGVDNPYAIFEPLGNDLGGYIQDQRTNKDSLKNKRAQYYFELRKRIYRTFQAVVHEVYCDPDELISFSSGCQSLAQLRSELCRMPIKPNSAGKFELYTKEEMKSRFKFKSPNLADTAMILMRQPYKVETVYTLPQPIPSMGIR